MTAVLSKFLAFMMAVISFLFPWLNKGDKPSENENWNTNYQYVFVHGLGGWGEYDIWYDTYPYWGGATGDYMKYLNTQGYNCVAASVTQNASAWDRTCELYAQLTGTVTDYGKAHSEACNHARYGKDYSKEPLITKWSSTDKINLLGHSFGGPTILLLQALMTNGSAEEIAATPAKEISPLFTGGKGDYIYSIVTLSSPINGTTAYCARDEINADPDATAEEKAVVALLSEVTKTPQDGRIEEDGATYSMSLDGAKELCDKYVTNPDCYYFSYATCFTTQNADGTWSPESNIEILFRAASARMGKHTCVSPGGVVVDASWQMNDGLVPTISAIAPYNAPKTDYDESNVESGVWNVMPIVHGDHTYFMGGITKPTDLKDFYNGLLDMINTLG